MLDWNKTLYKAYSISYYSMDVLELLDRKSLVCTGTTA